MWKPNLLTEIEADLLAEIKALINPPRPKRQLEFPVKKLERIPPPRRLIDFMGPDGERQRQKCQELVLQRYRELARPPQGLPSSPTPTLEAEEIARARRFDRYNCDLKKARLNFWEDFKFRYDDKERVDEELLKFLEAEPESKITPL